METTPTYVVIFLYLSTGFVLLSIPTVFVLYIVSWLKNKRNPDAEIVALKKSMSRLERGISISAGIGVLILGVILIAWILYNLFMNRLPEFSYHPIGLLFPLALIFFGCLYFRAGLSGQRVNFRIWGCKYCKNICYKQKMKTLQDVENGIGFINSNIIINTIFEIQSTFQKGNKPFSEFTLKHDLDENVDYYFQCSHCEQLFHLNVTEKNGVMSIWKPTKKIYNPALHRTARGGFF